MRLTALFTVLLFLILNISCGSAPDDPTNPAIRDNEIIEAQSRKLQGPTLMHEHAGPTLSLTNEAEACTDVAEAAQSFRIQLLQCTLTRESLTIAITNGDNLREQHKLQLIHSEIAMFAQITAHSKGRAQAFFLSISQRIEAAKRQIIL